MTNDSDRKNNSTTNAASTSASTTAAGGEKRKSIGSVLNSRTSFQFPTTLNRQLASTSASARVTSISPKITSSLNGSSNNNVSAAAGSSFKAGTTHGSTTFYVDLQSESNEDDIDIVMPSTRFISVTRRTVSNRHSMYNYTKTTAVNSGSGSDKNDIVFASVPSNIPAPISTTVVSSVDNVPVIPSIQRMIVPSEHQYPLLKDITSPSLANALKNGLKEVPTMVSGRLASSSALANIVDGGSNSESDADVMPIINGQSSEYQIPSFYQPPADISSKTAKNKPILNSKDLNILLMHVARIGDIYALRSLTKSPRLDMNIVDDEGRTPLIFSSIGGHLECVEVLLEHGAIVHQADYSGRSALHWASRYGKANIVKRLLKSGASVTSDDYQGKNALHCSSASLNDEVLKEILKHCKNTGLKFDDILNNTDDDGMTCLMWACFWGNYLQVHTLLSRLTQGKIDSLLKDVEGKTALHWTARNPHIQCASILISHCPSLLTAKDNYGRTLLHLSCSEGNVALCYFILSIDPSQVDEKDEEKRTALQWAAICGHSPILKLLCEFGASVNHKDKYGATPIFYAIQQNYHDCIHVLLRKNSDVSCADSTGRTPLIWASIQGYIDVIKILVEAKAEVNATDSKRLSALHYAAHSGHTPCCLYLIKNGANVNAFDKKIQIPLIKATASGHSETVLALISEGADVNLQDISGKSALSIGSAAGFIDIINILIGNGADVHAVDHKNTTALHEAAFHGKSDIIALLISRGASVNVKDMNGITPLHWAAVNGYLNCCKSLISHGAKVNEMAYDVDRDTPLDYAYLNDNFECAQLLIDNGALMAEDLLQKAVISIQKAWRRFVKYRKKPGILQLIKSSEL